jgi:signal transduction histidine kinase
MQDDLPLVQADSNQLTKAFINLIRNAIQAMPTGGRLSIKTFFEDSADPGKLAMTSTNGNVLIIFQDTGQGITSKELQQIFNPFFSTKDSGTGLGLPITHKVITEHHGQIDVESIKGQGTTFTIQLPIDEKISVQTLSGAGVL